MSQLDMSSSGGEYVAQGTYGCVFSPAEPCIGEDPSSIPSNQISKVFKDLNEAKVEEKEAKAVLALDPKMEFTLPFYKRCTLNISKTKPDGWDKCKHSTKKGTEFSQLRYENGGVDFDHIFKQYPKITIEEILPAFLSLLKGLIILNKANKVHQDIKPANMLYSHATKRVYLIDFGLSMPYSSLYQEKIKNIHAYDYPYYPPEYKLYHYMFMHAQKNKTFNEFATMFSRNLRGQPRLYQYLDKRHGAPSELKALYHIGEKILDDSQKEFKTHRNISKFHEQAGKEFRQFASKIDVYSLGITILSIIGKAHSRYQIGDMSSIIKHVFPVLFGMTCFDVSKRMTPEKAYRAYKQALIKIGLYKKSPARPKKAPVVKPAAPAPAAAAKKTKTKTCKPDEVLNAETNRCVKKTGRVGKQIEKAAMMKRGLNKPTSAPAMPLTPAITEKKPAPAPAKKTKTKTCKPDEVLNTETNRCVKKIGRVGKKIMKVAQAI
jgi:serine/threonine protein kinase